MPNQKNRYSFLFEQTTIVPNSEIQILEESKADNGNPRIAFAARLQESQVRNNNKRIYSDAICESIVGQLGPRAKARNMLMEIDNPVSQ